MRVLLTIVCLVGSLAFALAAAGCDAVPTAPAAERPPSSITGPAGQSPVKGMEGEIVMECSKTCEEFVDFDTPGTMCGCMVTTTCSNATYYWFSSDRYACGGGPAGWCVQGSAGCPN